MKTVRKKIISIFIFPATIFFVNYIINSFTLVYQTYWWADVVMHFLGGWSIAHGALFAWQWAEESGVIKIQTPLFRMILSVMTVLTMAVFWEFYEFLLDAFYGTSIIQPSVSDTMLDFVMGFLGGIAGAAVCFYTRMAAVRPGWRLPQRSKKPATPK